MGGGRADDDRRRRGVLDTASGRVRTGGTDGKEAEAADGRDGTPEAVTAPASLSHRLLWFALLWLGGVAAVSLVAWAIRAAILP